MVECSPATRAARVRFPANANFVPSLPKSVTGRFDSDTASASRCEQTFLDIFITADSTFSVFEFFIILKYFNANTVIPI